jgi:hypothetical protein
MIYSIHIQNVDSIIRDRRLTSVCCLDDDLLREWYGSTA